MTPQVFALFGLYTAAALAAALAALHAGRPVEVGLGRCRWAALAVAAVAAVFAVQGVTGPVRFGVFGVMQLAWLALAIVVPLSGLSLLLRRGPVSRGARALARFWLVMVPIALHAMFVEPARLQFETAALPSQAPLAAPLRIGVLSDIQCSTVTAHERGALARLMRETPDVILIAGDFFQGSRAHFERTRDDFSALLRSLSAPGGVWAVRGDVDGAGAGPIDGRSYFHALMRASGVNVLEDEAARFEVRGVPVELYGHDRWSTDPSKLLAFLSAPRAPGAARLVLSHRPDPVLLHGAGHDVDLFVAGHTHGGQVVIPFFGPPLTLTEVPRRVGAGGLHTVNGAPIYVSRGVGMERGVAPRVRFFCPPEVAVVTLLPGL